MGDEWGAREPFPFFCDFKGELAEAVREGRRKEFAEAYARHGGEVPDPLAEQTVRLAALDWTRSKKPDHRARLDLVRRLLAARKAIVMPACRNSPVPARAICDGVLTLCASAPAPRCRCWRTDARAAADVRRAGAALSLSLRRSACRDSSSNAFTAATHALSLPARASRSGAACRPVGCSTPRLKPRRAARLLRSRALRREASAAVGIPPALDLSLATEQDFGFDDAARIVPYLKRARHQPSLRLAISEGARRQPARL